MITMRYRNHFITFSPFHNEYTLALHNGRQATFTTLQAAHDYVDAQ